MNTLLFPPKPSLTVVYGRLLTCTRCHQDVDVIELPAPWIDANEYVCGQCLTPAVQLPTLPYDPATAPIPY